MMNLGGKVLMHLFLRVKKPRMLLDGDFVRKGLNVNSNERGGFPTFFGLFASAGGLPALPSL